MALVLVTDDELHIRQLLGEAIRQAGHQVLEANSSEAAMKVMAKQPADVAFCDIQMPGHDGRWLTLEIRRKYPATAVVIATAVGNLEPAITLRYGVLSYLLKPFDLKQVHQALTLAVAWHDDAVKVGPIETDPAAISKWLDSLDL